MAAMKCPYCGKKVKLGMEKCPKCGEIIVDRSNLDIDKIVKQRNKREISSLIICTIVGFFLGIYLYSVGAQFAGSEGGLAVGIMLVITGLFMGFGFYGMRCLFQATAGWSIWGLIAVPILGWFPLFALLMVIFMAGMVYGMFFKGPVAWIKLILKKPLVSREKILKEL